MEAAERSERGQLSADHVHNFTDAAGRAIYHGGATAYGIYSAGTNAAAAFAAGPTPLGALYAGGAVAGAYSAATNAYKTGEAISEMYGSASKAVRSMADERGRKR